LQFARHRTLCTAIAVPRAASSVAVANDAPGRGKSSGSPERRQVMQTKIVIGASVGCSEQGSHALSENITRIAPWAVSAGSGCSSGFRSIKPQ
jgi:hypothetical protein